MMIWELFFAKYIKTISLEQKKKREYRKNWMQDEEKKEINGLALK